MTTLARRDPLLPILSLGSSYYPPHHDEADWERDVKRMAEAGLNTIRSAELLASWDRIEIRRNACDWGWLDRLFELAAIYGLKVLLGTGSPSPPIWMLEEYPDLQIVSRDGVAYPTATVWGWACKENPGYRAELTRWINLLLERYATHPALLAWQIDNEPGFPLMARGGAGSIDHFCYCPHHTRGFREWLHRKYGDIAALNNAWRWDCTHHQYYDWHIVDPPRSMPSEWGGVTHWLDWRAYQYDALASFIGWQRQVIRQQDVAHPTCTNIFCWSGREVAMGMDAWRLAKEVDAIGYDIYPGIRHGFDEDPAYIPLYLSYAYSTARHNNVEFWLPEIESGPTDGWVMGPNHDTSAEDIERQNLLALAFGSKMLLYQGYREWPCIPIHWGALVDFHGEPTPRYDAAARIDHLVADNADLFREARPMPARIGLLYDVDNETAVYGMNAQDYHKMAYRGAFGALRALGYHVEFLDGPTLARGEHGYRMIVMPFNMLVKKGMAEDLRRFVDGGGTLVAFAKAAMLDDRGWSWSTRPGAGLDEVFGVVETRITRADPVWLRAEGDSVGEARDIPGYGHKQTLTAAPGARILARFADGHPAIVRHAYGAGTTFYCATHLDMAYDHEPSPAIEAVFATMAAAAGLEPETRLSADGADRLYVSRCIDARLMVRGDDRVLIMTNNGDQDIQLRVVMPALAGVAGHRGLFNAQGYTVSVDDAGVACGVTLAAGRGAVVVLEGVSVERTEKQQSAAASRGLMA